jgi:hypothetical protein
MGRTARLNATEHLVMAARRGTSARNKPSVVVLRYDVALAVAPSVVAGVLGLAADQPLVALLEHLQHEPNGALPSTVEVQLLDRGANRLSRLAGTGTVAFHTNSLRLYVALACLSELARILQPGSGLPGAGEDRLLEHMGRAFNDHCDTRSVDVPETCRLLGTPSELVQLPLTVARMLRQLRAPDPELDKLVPALKRTEELSRAAGLALASQGRARPPQKVGPVATVAWDELQGRVVAAYAKVLRAAVRTYYNLDPPAAQYRDDALLIINFLKRYAPTRDMDTLEEKIVLLFGQATLNAMDGEGLARAAARLKQCIRTSATWTAPPTQTQPVPAAAAPPAAAKASRTRPSGTLRFPEVPRDDPSTALRPAAARAAAGPPPAAALAPGSTPARTSRPTRCTTVPRGALVASAAGSAG